jgi:hypothetical protein
MKKLFVIMLLMIAMPAVVSAKAPKGHVKTNNQECSECHANAATTWLNGKHGLMTVKCVICHGSTEKNFAAKPGIDRCNGCHEELVEQVKRRPTAGQKSCSPCHDHHSVAVKNPPVSPFHVKGGN